MNTDPVDIITLLVALLALVTSREIAHTVSPYAAIMVLACAGAALSLSGNEKPMTTLQASVYVSVRVGVAIVLTVSIAEGLQLIAPWAKPRYTLIPLAFAIGWIRDYETVRTWFGDMITRFTVKKIDDGK